MTATLKHDDLILKVGTNQFELLEFWIEREEENGEIYKGVYGINVSKVLEVIRMTELTEVPKPQPYLLGIIQLRGKTIPIISLAKWMGIPEAKRDKQDNKIIVAEFNNIPLGFEVHQVNRIRRIAWEKIHVPPELVNEQHGGTITGTTLLDDNRLLLIIDLEKIVDELSPIKKEAVFKAPPTEMGKTGKKRNILVADDSLVARKQVQMSLIKGNFDVETVVNGREALEKLEGYYKISKEKGIPIRDLLYLVVCDVEMPQMDGYTFTRIVKNDVRFRDIPVILHSSLSGKANIAKGKGCGCDSYMVKFDPKDLLEEVSSF